MQEIKTKKIKINNRGIFSTSRGRFFGPLGPYVEKVDNITVMIAREKANITEVLDDGTEVQLTIQNVSKDNSVKVDAKPTKPVEPIVTPKPEETKPVQTAREMSKKEKRRMENEKKQQEVAKKDETKPADTSVPAEAIEA